MPFGCRKVQLVLAVACCRHVDSAVVPHELVRRGRCCWVQQQLCDVEAVDDAVRRDGRARQTEDGGEQIHRVHLLVRHHSYRAVSTSHCSTRRTTPAGIWPVQRASPGTRMPPSYVCAWRCLSVPLGCACHQATLEPFKPPARPEFSQPCRDQAQHTNS
jgi:hypothetical protein